MENSKVKQKKRFFCEDKLFDKSLSVIKVEHCQECPVFGEKAFEVFKLVVEKFPQRQFKLLVNHSELNGEAIEPRFGAFEVWFARNCRETYHLLWSGLDKGPPRREKFPQDLDEIQRKVLKLLVTG